MTMFTFGRGSFFGVDKSIFSNTKHMSTDGHFKCI